MFVSTKNLAFIQLIPAEVAPAVDLPKPPHERIDFPRIPGLRRELGQPLAKGRIQGLVLRARYEAGLLNQVFIGAQSYVLHTKTVYTITVYILNADPSCSNRQQAGHRD